ncbi:head-tail adaptor protein [Paracoccus sp. Z118]|uniref:head-tail adaptor protein n=1 Tax=Paracoccus sp. Z118 TaxID=2851017 RepID=UPI001C2C1DDC|nr:head-tail adaptor protein [Paracoccus sp. Z118]MBV0891934.1 head-tail adaptor protein [Paracoccus sp. Z118]
MRAPNVPLLLEAAERVSDGLGGYMVRWVPVGRLYGAMRAGAGRSGLAEVGAESVVSWKITVRGAPEGDPRRPAAGQRFRMGARLFAIDAVAEGDGAGRWLVCTAREERQA